METVVEMSRNILNCYRARNFIYEVLFYKRKHVLDYQFIYKFKSSLNKMRYNVYKLKPASSLRNDAAPTGGKKSLKSNTEYFAHIIREIVGSHEGVIFFFHL